MDNNNSIVETEMSNKKFVCQYCEESKSSKHRLQEHENICPVKKYIETHPKVDLLACIGENKLYDIVFREACETANIEVLKRLNSLIDKKEIYIYIYRAAKEQNITLLNLLKRANYNITDPVQDYCYKVLDEIDNKTLDWAKKQGIISDNGKLEVTQFVDENSRTIICKQYYRQYITTKELHREYGKPAVIHYDIEYPDHPLYECYYSNGMKFRDNGWAEIYYYSFLECRDSKVNSKDNIRVRKVCHYILGKINNNEEASILHFDIDGNLTKAEYVQEENNILKYTKDIAFIEFGKKGEIKNIYYTFSNVDNEILSEVDYNKLNATDILCSEIKSNTNNNYKQKEYLSKTYIIENVGIIYIVNSLGNIKNYKIGLGKCFIQERFTIIDDKELLDSDLDKDEPAEIVYLNKIDTELIVRQRWYKAGKLHRNNDTNNRPQPAWIEYAFPSTGRHKLFEAFATEGDISSIVWYENEVLNLTDLAKEELYSSNCELNTNTYGIAFDDALDLKENLYVLYDDFQHKTNKTKSDNRKVTTVSEIVSCNDTTRYQQIHPKKTLTDVYIQPTSISTPIINTNVQTVLDNTSENINLSTLEQSFATILGYIRNISIQQLQAQHNLSIEDRIILLSEEEQKKLFDEICDNPKDRFLELYYLDRNTNLLSSLTSQHSLFNMISKFNWDVLSDSEVERYIEFLDKYMISKINHWESKRWVEFILFQYSLPYKEDVYNEWKFKVSPKLLFTLYKKENLWLSSLEKSNRKCFFEVYKYYKKLIDNEEITEEEEKDFENKLKVEIENVSYNTYIANTTQNTSFKIQAGILDTDEDNFVIDISDFTTVPKNVNVISQINRKR